MHKKHVLALLVTSLYLLADITALAAPALRIQVNQKGDFVLIGNTLAQECDPLQAAAPVVGTLPNCGTTGLTDSAPDVYWRADVPTIGTSAQADIATTSLNARTGAKLNLPAGATVSHAFLYWAASVDTGVQPSTTVKLDRPGTGGFNTDVNALTVVKAANGAYQAVANVTALVQAQGAGYYRVGGFNAATLANVTNNNNFAGWWMAIFYQLPTDPPRNLALFDGFDSVNSVANSITATLSGFKVPNAGFSGKLGVITFEGDNTTLGDGLAWNGAALSDTLNPVNNFFNGTRSFFGSPVSVVGDLPQLLGTVASMSGIDLDVVDITSKLTAGQTSATINATTSADAYFLSGFITSITTLKQDFTTSTKAVSDLNGGAVLVGDVLQYTITVTNAGNDDSVSTVVNDPLPAGVSFVPGSLEVTSGAGTGPKTDTVGDDTAEYDAAKKAVVFRVGTSATGTAGGQVPVGQSTTVTFQVKINAGAAGTISNQATVISAGKQGAPTENALTDGNGPTAGAPPTSISIDACVDDMQCAPPTPHCNTMPTPNVCVECINDSQCSGSKATCQNNACICVPSGAEVCDGKDCHTDVECGAGQSGRVCDPLRGMCLDGCRGKSGNGCPQGETCTSNDASIGSCGVHCLGSGPTSECVASNECDYGFCDPATQICRAGHKLDGAPCSGGICIAGGCFIEMTSSGGSDMGASTGSSEGGGGTSQVTSSSGSSSHDAAGAGGYRPESASSGPGSGGADADGDIHPIRLHGGACSTGQDVSTPVPFLWAWLALAVQRLRRRNKRNCEIDKT